MRLIGVGIRGCSFNLPEGRLSKSVAKTRIGPERRKRIVDIPGFYSRPIPARDAFATDLDTSTPRTVPGAPPAPPRARQQPAGRLVPAHGSHQQDAGAVGAGLAGGRIEPAAVVDLPQAARDLALGVGVRGGSGWA